MSKLEIFGPKPFWLISAARRRVNSGFSITELLVVLAVVAIMLTISLPYLLNYRKLYRSDDQAIKLMDMMQEASQYALTRRRTVRFQIDLTRNVAMIIDEAGTDPDFLLKSIPLDKTADVRVDTAPSGITRPNPPNYANAVFAMDTLGHREGTTTVINNNVWAIRFQRDGSALNAAGLPVSATLFVWPPVTAGGATARNSREVRAITIFAPSSAVRFWKYNGTTFVSTVN